jgi:hypothetical protein
MVIVKSDEVTEAGRMPVEQELVAMGKFNDALVEAGIMLSGEGLHPSVKGKRVRFNGAARTVIDGPFGGARDLVAGFWIWEVRSMAEAVEWVKRAPLFDDGAEVEIRPMFETEEFGKEATPEILAQEARQRARIDCRKQGRPDC